MLVMFIYLVLLNASRSASIKTYQYSEVVITSTEGCCGSKDYSITLSHSRILRADSAGDLSKMVFPCCLVFYVGLW